MSLCTYQGRGIQELLTLSCNRKLTKILNFKDTNINLNHFRQFSNVYYKHWEKGIYQCVVCGVNQFSSKTKYDSGSGWPSFYDVMDKNNIRKRQDASGGTNFCCAMSFVVCFLLSFEQICK